jgi:general secretion pathway protein M
MIAQRLSAWWTGLARRERMMVLIAASVVLLGTLYAAGIEPAWTARARLAEELPRLQAELVQLEALRTEAKRLAGQDGVGQSFDSLVTAVEQSTLRANVSAVVRADDANTVSVTANDVPAAAWFVWLEAFTRESRTAVMVASARRAETPGRIDAFVSFRASAN